MSALSINQKLLISFLVGIIVGAFSVWLWFLAGEPAQAPDTATKEEASNTIPLSENGIKKTTLPLPPENTLPPSPRSSFVSDSLTSGERVSISNQKAGTTVYLDSAVLSASTWIAVHENVTGSLGNALGAVRLRSGEHDRVSIELLRETTPNKTYHLVFYRDNGDQEFDLRSDIRVLTLSQNPIQASFETLP